VKFTRTALSRHGPTGLFVKTQVGETSSLSVVVLAQGRTGDLLLGNVDVLFWRNPCRANPAKKRNDQSTILRQRAIQRVRELVLRLIILVEDVSYAAGHDRRWILTLGSA